MGKNLIKFPLEMENNVKVRSLEELKANFSLKKVIEYYENGKLARWLSAQNLSEMAEGIKNLRGNSPDFYKELYRILDIEYDEHIKATEEKEKEYLEDMHVCHRFSKMESGKSTTTYGIFLKDMKTGNVTEIVPFTENELIKNRLGEKIWYERHGQWVLYLKANKAERNAAQTYSFHRYDLLSHKERILCEQLPESESDCPRIHLYIYNVTRERILWQCNDTLYLSEHNKQTQIYSNSQSEEQNALCHHPDFRSINYRMNSVMTLRGVLFTATNVVNPLEKTLYYYSLSTHDTTLLTTGCSISAPIESNDKLYFSMKGTLFFVDEEKLEIHEICPLRDNAESSDRLESIQENEDYIVWIVRKHPESSKEMIKFLECYTKQEKARKELERFDSGFAEKGILSQSEISLTIDQICYKEFATNYAGETFAEKETQIGYDGTGKTKWVTTMENREWTSVDAGSNGYSILPSNRFDELPFSLYEYLVKRQDMLTEMEKQREKLRQDGLMINNLPVLEQL